MHHSKWCSLKSKLQAHVPHLLIFDAQVLMALDNISQQLLMRLQLALHRMADVMFMHNQPALSVLVQAI